MCNPNPNLSHQIHNIIILSLLPKLSDSLWVSSDPFLNPQRVPTVRVEGCCTGWTRSWHCPLSFRRKRISDRRRVIAAQQRRRAPPLQADAAITRSRKMEDAQAWADCPIRGPAIACLQAPVPPGTRPRGPGKRGVQFKRKRIQIFEKLIPGCCSSSSNCSPRNSFTLPPPLSATPSIDPSTLLLAKSTPAADYPSPSPRHLLLFNTFYEFRRSKRRKDHLVEGHGNRMTTAKELLRAALHRGGSSSMESARSPSPATLRQNEQKGGKF